MISRESSRSNGREKRRKYGGKRGGGAFKIRKITLCRLGVGSTKGAQAWRKEKELKSENAFESGIFLSLL